MGGKHSSEKLFEKVTKTIRDAANQGAKEIGESFEIVEKAIADGNAKISQVDGKVTITYDVKSDDNIENKVDNEIDKTGKQIKEDVEKATKNGLEVDYPIKTNLITRKLDDKTIKKSMNDIAGQLDSAYNRAIKANISSNSDATKNTLTNFIQQYIGAQNAGALIPSNVTSLFNTITGQDGSAVEFSDIKQAYAEYANYIQAETTKVIDSLNKQKEATKQLREEQKKTTSATSSKKNQNKNMSESNSGIKEKTNAIKDNTEALNQNANAQKSDGSGKQKTKIDSVSKAYEVATGSLKKYYELKQKEYSKGNLEDNDVLKEYKAELVDAIKYIKKYANTTEEAAVAQKKLDDVIANYNNSFSGNVSNNLLSKLNVASNKSNKTTGYYEEIERIRNLIKELDVPIDFTNQKEIEQLKDTEKTIRDMMKNLNNREFDLVSEDKINSSLTSAYKSLYKDTKAPEELRDRLKKVIAEFEKLKNSGEEVDGIKFDKLQNELKEVQLEIQKTGKTGASMGDKIKKKFGDVAAYFATYVSIQDAIRIIRSGFETIKEYDTALTEMNKVSKESINTLKEFQQESFELADAVGTTASQIQNSTADFLRLGESFEQAKQSAQDANALFKVSEFSEISEATDALIAMSQAYSELEKSEINDILNYTGNNFSISTSELASALQKSSATLKVAGNDIYEATALVTAGNAVLQDAESVGTGLKMISLRILGTEEAKNELASLGEDVDDFVVQTQSKLDETIRNYTAVASNDFKGISILDDNGNYKSTFEILRDISEVYQEILEADKKAGTNRGQALLEVLAGKNRSNVAASILQNPELLTSVYEETLTKSQGSVAKELESQLASIESHLNELKNAWDKLWVNENNREVITFFIDLGTSILKAVDDFGVLQSLLLGGGGIFAAFKSFKGEGRVKKFALMNMPSVA